MDLAGLEHAKNLDALDLSQNDINNLDPLAGLTSLTRLRLSNNYIADTRPLAGLTNLAELYLDNDYQGHYDWNAPNQNQIGDIGPLAGLTQLTFLDLGRDHVADVSALSGMTKLTSLSLCYNQITDVSRLAGLRSLTHLDIGSNQISDIVPLKDLAALDWLSVRFDPITDVAPLENLTALKDLNIEGTLVTDIGALASLKNLRWFQASYSPVASLEPLRGLTNLTWLGFYGSRSIHDISPLAGLTKLQELSLTSNYISDVAPLSGLTALRALSLADNRVSDIRPLANLTTLTGLDLRDNQITDISGLTGMTSLADLWLNGNPLNAMACAIHIPLIKANNPGVVIHYDDCAQWWTLTISSTEGGSVVMPGEDAFVYFTGESAPVEAVAEEGYQFTYWSGTAVDANAMLDPSAPHTSVTMGADYSLVANFKPQEQAWSTVYFNNFEDQVGPEWSHNAVDATPIGARRFLGQFGNDAVTLALTGLPPHSRVRLSFDLFAIRSWDGNGEVWGVGPDRWVLTLDGLTTLLDTTFENHPYAAWHDVDDAARNAATWQTQAFPGNYPAEQHPSQTGAAETVSLGYAHSGVGLPQDSVYHLTFTCEHDTSNVTVCFSASGLQALGDESWGLDNVRIEVLAPVSDATLTISSTVGGAVTSPGEGQFKYKPGTVVSAQAVSETGYHFTHWSGAAVEAGKVADPASASATVMVDGDYTLIANFAPDQKSLTVSSTAGGSVTIPGSGVFQYAYGTSAPIQAMAAAHHHFTHWSGTAVAAGKVADPASPNTSVVLDADYTLAANFKIDQHRLTVTAATGGYIYVETKTGNVVSAWYDKPIPPLDHGTEVTVIATPYDGWKFTGWSGTMGSSESPFLFELTQDCTLQALFVPE